MAAADGLVGGDWWEAAAAEMAPVSPPPFPATTMMSWLANFAKRRCVNPTRTSATSCGRNIASTKGLRARRMIRALLSLVLRRCLPAAPETVKSTSVPVLDAPATLTPDEELLDVGVVILDPGISAVEDEEQVYPEVRKAEATFMATSSPRC